MGFQKSVENILANVKTPGEGARKAAAAALSDYGDTRMFDDDEDEDEDDIDDEDDMDGDDEYVGEDDEIDLDDDDEDSSVEPIFLAGKKKTPAKKNGRDVQMLLFSATMPTWICKLTDKHMNDPIFLDAVQEGENRLATTISHLAVKIPSFYDRLQSVSAYVEDLILTKGAGGQTIVFTNTKEEADNLVAADCFGQLRCQVLHGDIGQNSRQATIKAFKEGSIEVLVATDVAARGLDIAGVDLVLNTGTPMDFDTYVHRAGRTGRAGRNGTSIMLYSGADEKKLKMFESQLNFRFERIGPPSPQQIIEASAVYAAKRLTTVQENIAKYFVPHARSLLNKPLRQKRHAADDDSNDDEDTDNDMEFQGMVDREGATSYSAEHVEQIVARCLAAISNRNSISCRSMLTGENDIMTLKINAVFKNGSSPATTRDWQRLLAGVIRRSLDVEEGVKFGKTVMARDDDRSVIALIDVPYEIGTSILSKLNEVGLPGGIKISQVDAIPRDIIEDRSRTDSWSDRGGSRGEGGTLRRGSWGPPGGREGGYRGGGGAGGGGGYRRDGDRGGSSYGANRGGGGGSYGGYGRDSMQGSSPPRRAWSGSVGK